MKPEAKRELLWRMVGSGVLGEAYAEIVPGRLGPEQTPPGREFEPNRSAIWRGPEDSLA